MVYRFEQGEPIPVGVRRIVGEQVKHALAQLQVGERDHREGIHEARKSFKKVRGVLRLVRFELGASFRRENDSYRSMGLLLAQARDAEAMIESLEKLEALPDEMFGPELLVPLRRFLMERRDHLIREDLDLRKRLMIVASEASIALRRMDSWPLNSDGFEALEAGFRRSYRQARRRYSVATAFPSDEHYHEWRKRSKSFWYHTRLLSPNWIGEAETAAEVEAFREALDQLNDLLGDHHDLAVLKQILRREAPAHLKRHQIRGLNGALIERQLQIERRADSVGRAVLTRRPKKLIAQLRQSAEPSPDRRMNVRNGLSGTMMRGSPTKEVGSG